ncbi:MAG: hypothetical protein ACR2FZ_08350, partial [Thermoleophilaceae bacterium]
SGNSGNDRVSGNSGNDRLFAGSGNDRVFGGSGNDRIFVRDDARDGVDCGRGFDRVIADRRDRTRNCEVVTRR